MIFPGRRPPPPSTLPTSDNVGPAVRGPAPEGTAAIPLASSMCPPGMVATACYSPTVTCSVCKTRMSAHLLSEHECGLVAPVFVDGLGEVTIYLHLEKEWPHPRGHHVPTPRQLAGALIRQHPELVRRFMVELYTTHDPWVREIMRGTSEQRLKQYGYGKNIEEK